IDIFNDDGTINDKVGMYVGMDRFECRKVIEGDLQAAGLMEKVEAYTNNVGYSERTGVAIEPKLSMQWFLSMKEIAEPATKAVLEDSIKFIPAKYKNTYRHWMENIKDWCISRQLWWGQRIPAYYLPKGGYVIAPTAEEALLKAREKAQDESLQLSDLRQDEDVLDTWFSSWLWPISVFDGIRNPDNEEIKYYYPTADLVTGPDIIFFWVARMIMAGYEYRADKPFGNVYFTGIVRDKLGRKMSKQLGNSPDPLDLIAQYGADGMRVAMMLSSSAGNDVMFDEALCEQGRNFGNKIWNAYRLINGWEVDENLSQTKNNAISIMWFEHTLSKAIAEIDEMFASYRISEAFMRIYKLFWDEFSGWYLELVKPAYQTPIDRETMDATRRFFDLLMRLIHPFMPFVTEEIWQDLEPRKAGESIMYAPMPKATAVDENLLMRFDLVKEIISNVRNIRKQRNIPQRKTLTLNFILDENFPAELADVVVKMCNLENVAAVEKKNPAAESFMVKTTQYFIPMEDSIDVEAELKKLSDELTYLEGFLASVMKKLSNERFVQSAPEKVVANERAKQADAEAKIAAIKERMEALK
ncbi:MAG: class I tRNA ligase family protein, partial [Alistipes sp.]|nr:class I tRNA ligase family protein [Alistipes sp.]